MSPTAFLVLAALTLAAALTVILHPNPVYSAIGLVATLCLLAVLFAGLDAQLVAVLQVIVYAGAIVVLFLFVIMLLNLQVERRTMAGAGLIAVAAGGGMALAALVVVGLRHAPAGEVGAAPAGYGDTVALAERLFTAYLLPFELTSVLLLVAVVGAVAVAKRRP